MFHLSLVFFSRRLFRNWNQTAEVISLMPQPAPFMTWLGCSPPISHSCSLAPPLPVPTRRFPYVNKIKTLESFVMMNPFSRALFFLVFVGPVFVVFVHVSRLCPRVIYSNVESFVITLFHERSLNDFIRPSSAGCFLSCYKRFDVGFLPYFLFLRFGQAIFRS